MTEGKSDVDATEGLGGKQLRVFGRAPWPETEAEQEEMWAPMIESLREICDYAAPKGIEIAIQNHNRSSFCMYGWQVMRTSLAQHAAYAATLKVEVTSHMDGWQILRMMRDVGKPNFGHIMDTGQWKGAIGPTPPAPGS
jgi:sugar phosphate isomerase/epimerase